MYIMLKTNRPQYTQIRPHSSFESAMVESCSCILVVTDAIEVSDSMGLPYAHKKLTMVNEVFPFEVL